MMEILSRRRSIRAYRDEPILEEQVESLLQAGLLAASSRSIRPWELIAVTDPDLLAALADAKQHGSKFLAGAPLGVVILGIPGASDVWIEDASIAASNILLQAEALGLGACWIQIRNRRTADGRSSEDAVRELLHIPESRSVEAVIAVGYPAEHKQGYDRQDLPWDKVFRNTWKG